MVYEGRLKAAEGNEKQKVALPAKRRALVPVESGLVYVPVRHEGNSQASDEEVEVIKEIVDDLLGRDFQAKDGMDLLAPEP